jgi:hypothetical protein
VLINDLPENPIIQKTGVTISQCRNDSNSQSANGYEEKVAKTNAPNTSPRKTRSACCSASSGRTETWSPHRDLNAGLPQPIGNGVRLGNRGQIGQPQAWQNWQ